MIEMAVRVRNLSIIKTLITRYGNAKVVDVIEMEAKRNGGKEKWIHLKKTNIKM